MSSSRRKPVIGGAFVAHTLEMRRSPAWRSLPDNARRVLDRLEVEHMQHAGSNNGQLICTYADFARAGIRRASIALAIRQLVALGFLQITRKGGRAIAHVRQPTRYRLTYPPVKSCWQDRAGNLVECDATNDWRLIKTDAEAADALARAAEHRDYRTQPRRRNEKPDSTLQLEPDSKMLSA